jgi:hypothetical protein
VDLNSFCTSVLDNQELTDCFLNLPGLNYEPFPLDFEHIAQGQQTNDSLLQRRMLHPLLYSLQYFSGCEMISYRITPTARWQICIPTKQLIILVRWFHEVLGHCGIHRLCCDSIGTHFSHPQLRATVNDIIKHCRACQINKLAGPGYGHLPLLEATALPFQEVSVYLIGPWHVTVPNEVYEFYALTCIDLATNFPEAIRIHNKNASHVGMQF